MQPRNLPGQSIVLRELTLLRALGVSLRTVRPRPARRSLPPLPVRHELLPTSRPPLLDGFPAAVPPEGWTGQDRSRG